MSTPDNASYVILTVLSIGGVSGDKATNAVRSVTIALARLTLSHPSSLSFLITIRDFVCGFVRRYARPAVCALSSVHRWFHSAHLSGVFKATHKLH